MAFKYYLFCALVAAGTASAGVIPTNHGMDYMNQNSFSSNMAGNGYQYSNQNIPMPSADHLHLQNDMQKPQQMMHHHDQSSMMTNSNYDQYNQQGHSFMSHDMMKPFEFGSSNNNYEMMHSNYNNQPMTSHMSSYNHHMDMGHGHNHMDMGHGHNHNMGHEMHNNGFQEHHQMMMPSHGSMGQHHEMMMPSHGHHHQLLPMHSDINMASFAQKHTSMPNAIMSDRKGYAYSPSASVSNVAFNGMGTNYKY